MPSIVFDQTWTGQKFVELSIEIAFHGNRLKVERWTTANLREREQYHQTLVKSASENLRKTEVKQVAKKHIIKRRRIRRSGAMEEG